MTEVIIDGIKYVPKAEIPELTDQRLQECLEVLTEMRHFNQHHKMMVLAWNAINALSPELAKLPENEAYERIHSVTPPKDRGRKPVVLTGKYRFQQEEYKEHLCWTMRAFKSNKCLICGEEIKANGN